MISDSDGLEEALRENLKLRSELAVEVAKSRERAQRLRRGFHRLGLISALIAGAVRIAFIRTTWSRCVCGKLLTATCPSCSLGR
jgi:hypothetical protein